MMTRAEHLQWCKDRALQYADLGDGPTALASLRPDLGKHPDTSGSARIVDELMFPLMMNGHMNSPRELRSFIEGLN